MANRPLHIMVEAGLLKWLEREAAKTNGGCVDCLSRDLMTEALRARQAADLAKLGDVEF